jgi:outer membrane protein assembly factor BamB
MVDKATYVIALDLNGKELWRRLNGESWQASKGQRWAVSYAGSRATPTVDGNSVYHLSDLGKLTSFDPATGEERWKVDLCERFDAERPKYGYSESVLVHGDRLICCPGGRRGAVAALEKKGGRTVWANTDFVDPIGYASPVAAEIEGVPQFVLLTASHVFAVAADDGRLLWRHPFGNKRNNNVPDPIVHQGRVFLSTGYGKGSALFRPRRQKDGRFTVETVWTTERMDNHHGGVVLFDGHLYGAGHEARGWFCLEFETGKERWSSPGKGSLTFADGRLYCLDEKGTMSLVLPAPERFTTVGSFTVPRGGRGHFWAHPVVCGGRLYVRHGDRLHAYDLAPGKGPGTIHVKCGPGVEIHLDGEYRGKSAADGSGFTIPNIPEGLHKIQAARKGLEPQEEVVHVKAGETLVFAVKPGPPSEELKALVRRLGALEERHWKPAMEALSALGDAAVPGLNWGLRFPLQNVRARCCTILSRMPKSEFMIPGALNALKTWPDDVTPHEARIRRWAARLLCDLPSVHTEEAMRWGIARDKDPGVRVFLAAGLARLGVKSNIPDLIQALACEDPEVAGWAADAIAQVLPQMGLLTSGFAGRPVKERTEKSAAVLAWWQALKEMTELVRAEKNYEPRPVRVEVKTYVAPSEPIDPEDEREVELCVRDAEEALARGDLRRATAFYANAFRFSGRRRFDLVLKQHECWRRLGPDHAHKSYQYLHMKLLQVDPLNSDFWLAAAKSARASGGQRGREDAIRDLEMVLVLVPDHAESMTLIEEIKKEGGD